MPFKQGQQNISHNPIHGFASHAICANSEQRTWASVWYESLLLYQLFCGWTDEQRCFQARPGGWTSPQPKAERLLVGKGCAHFLGSDPPSGPFLLLFFLLFFAFYLLLFCIFFVCIFLRFSSVFCDFWQKYPKLKVPNLDRGAPRSAGHLPTCTSFPSLPPSPPFPLPLPSPLSLAFRSLPLSPHPLHPSPSPSSYPSLPFPPPTPPPPLPLAQRFLDCALWSSSLQTPLLEKCALRMFCVKAGPLEWARSLTARPAARQLHATYVLPQPQRNRAMHWGSFVVGWHDVLQVSLTLLHTS